MVKLSCLVLSVPSPFKGVIVDLRAVIISSIDHDYYALFCKVLILVTLPHDSQNRHLDQFLDNCTTGETFHHCLQAFIESLKTAIPLCLADASLFTVCSKVRSTGFVDKFVFVCQMENPPNAGRWRRWSYAHKLCG